MYSIRDGRSVGYAATTINGRLAAISGSSRIGRCGMDRRPIRCRTAAWRGSAAGEHSGLLTHPRKPKQRSRLRYGSRGGGCAVGTARRRRRCWEPAHRAGSGDRGCCFPGCVRRRCSVWGRPRCQPGIRMRCGTLSVPRWPEAGVDLAVLRALLGHESGRAVFAEGGKQRLDVDPGVDPSAQHPTVPQHVSSASTFRHPEELLNPLP